MKTSYKLIIRTAIADKLYSKWANQGWTATPVVSNTVTTTVWIDMVTDKNVDPTAHKGILQVLS